MAQRTADAVVVGGGISGACTAYYLTQLGVDVLLIERNGLASQASGFAYGGLSPLSGVGIPGAMFPLAEYSFRLHQELMGIVSDDSTDDPGYRHVDSLDLALSQAESEHHDTKVNWINQQDGFEAESLSLAQILALDSRINPEIVGGVYSQGSLHLDSESLTRFVAKLSKV